MILIINFYLLETIQCGVAGDLLQSL